MQGEDFQGLLIPQEYNYSGEKSDHHMHWIWKTLYKQCVFEILDAVDWWKQRFKSVSLRKSKELFIRNKT